MLKKNIINIILFCIILVNIFFLYYLINKYDFKHLVNLSSVNSKTYYFLFLFLQLLFFFCVLFLKFTHKQKILLFYLSIIFSLFFIELVWSKLTRSIELLVTEYSAFLTLYTILFSSFNLWLLKKTS